MAQARRNRKKRTPAWVWLLIGILLGFFFSHVDFLQAYHFLEASLEKSQGLQSHSNKSTGREETKFDFYNILSERTANQDIKSEPESPKEHRVSKSFQNDSEEFNLSMEKKRIQNELSDLDAATHKRLPPSDKRSVTQLPLLSKQRKQELLEPPTSHTPQAKLLSKAKVVPHIPREEKIEQKLLAPVVKEFKAKPEEKNKLSEKVALQIASMRRYAEADQLKAQLLMLGFQGIHIQKISKGQEIWFRVNVGNNLDRKDAERIKKKLLQNNVHSIIVPK